MSPFSTRRLATGCLWFALGLVLTLAGCKDRRIIRCDTCPRLIVYPAITSEATLIANFEAAYQRRDYDKLKALFSNPTQPIPAQPAYRFFLSEPTPTHPSWGYTEEMRIHRRMFKPQDPLPGETPVDPDLWLQSVDIRLTLQTDFVERADLYRSPSNPDGLDSARWRATEGVYATSVFFQLAGNTDFMVNGHANFVVIEDKTKTNDDPGKWLIYRWEDLAHKPSGAEPPAPAPAAAAAVETLTWGHVKQLYSAA